MANLKSHWLLLMLAALSLGQGGHSELMIGGDIAKVMYEWVRLDADSYDFSTPGGNAAFKEWVEGEKLSAEHGLIHGIKIYEGEVLVSIPRLGPGVPSTLNKLVTVGNKTILQPYPSWAWQKLEDCSAFQTVQSFEVDPHKGWLWVIDSGRVQTFFGGLQNLCPPKVVIYNMKTGETVRHYEFPEDVAVRDGNFLADIVVDNQLDIAYISNLGEGTLLMYSYPRNLSVAFTGSTTYPRNITPIKVRKDYINLSLSSAGVDGVALSPDGFFLYYGPLSEPVVYQVNTSFMHSCFDNPKWSRNIDMFAVKMPQSEYDGHTRGRVMGERSMFYGGIGSDTVYQWHWEEDTKDKKSIFDMGIFHRDPLVRDTERILWIESLGIDGKSGYLWFTSINLAEYFLRKMDITGKKGPNMYIWRVFIDEGSYNFPYVRTTTPPTTTTTERPQREVHYEVGSHGSAYDNGAQLMATASTLKILVLLQILGAFLMTVHVL